MRCYNDTIPTPRYYNLSATCHAHGWRHLAPFAWDAKRRSLTFALQADGEPVDVRVRQPRRRIEVELVSAQPLHSAHRDFIQGALVRALDLATQTVDLYERSRSIHRRYAELVSAGAGRLLRAPSLWEDVAKTLFTTNCSWSLTRIMSNAACSSRFSTATAGGAFPFPGAEKIARLRAATLKEHMRVGYRAAFIKAIAGQLHRDQRTVDIAGLSESELRAYFNGLAGFGPYASNHMMVLCGYFSEIPVDSVVRTYLQQQHRTEAYADFITEHYDRWAPYQWWGMRLERMPANACLPCRAANAADSRFISRGGFFAAGGELAICVDRLTAYNERLSCNTPASPGGKPV